MTQLAENTASTAPVTPAKAAAEPQGIDVAWLGEYLLGRWAEERKTSRELVKDPAL